MYIYNRHILIESESVYKLYRQALTCANRKIVRALKPNRPTKRIYKSGMLASGLRLVRDERTCKGSSTAQPTYNYDIISLECSHI